MLLKRCQKRLCSSNKDEYGDLVYDGIDWDSKQSKDLKKASQIMQYWINKMFLKQPEEAKQNLFNDMFRPKVVKFDKETQVRETTESMTDMVR